MPFINNQVQPILLHHYLENSANRFPSKCAIIHDEKRFSYLDVDRAANSLANYLIAFGVKSGDRVVLLLENSFELIVGYFGALKAGATVVPLGLDIDKKGLEEVLNRVESNVLIAATRFERLLNQVEKETLDGTLCLINRWSNRFRYENAEILDMQAVLQNGNEETPELPVNPSALSTIIFTSGSSGRPKGVMLTHENLMSNTSSICQYLKLSEQDIQMVVLPFSYVMGLSLLNTHVAVGGTLVINNKFAYPATVVTQMIEESVTGFSGVPSTYAYLLHRSQLREKKDQLKHLRYCSQAGGHMPRTLKLDLRSALPNHTDIYIMYGATEASARLSYLPPEYYLSKIDSIGIPIPGVGLDIVDNQGKTAVRGDSGELRASGPNIMQGYWGDDESTRNVIKGNSYFTGDIGYQDEDGFIFLTGRKDIQLKVRGHKVNPQLVEDIITSSENVLEAVVFGIEDELDGQRLIAFIVGIREGSDVEAAVRMKIKSLTSFKRPSEIHWIKALPKTANSKTDRSRCLQLLRDNYLKKTGLKKWEQ